MDPVDTTLRARLESLEESVPVGAMRSALHRRDLRRIPVAVAAALSLTLFVGGFAVGRGLGPAGPVGHEGLENPGQPFYGTRLHCLTPPQAAELMAGRNFTVVWQVEDRDAAGNGTTSLEDVAPQSGAIAGGFAIGSVAHVVVEVGPLAARAPDCA